jgi:hypothetical protein
MQSLYRGNARISTHKETHAHTHTWKALIFVEEKGLEQLQRFSYKSTIGLILPRNIEKNTLGHIVFSG